MEGYQYDDGEKTFHYIDGLTVVRHSFYEIAHPASSSTFPRDLFLAG